MMRRRRGGRPHVSSIAGLELTACARLFAVARRACWHPSSCWPAAREWATWARARRPARRRRRRRISAPARSRSASSCRCRPAATPAVAAQSMRNAAEMALAEFNNPDLQLLVKDDGGNAQGAQQVAQQVLDEGAEIILGPLFALTVGPVGRVARARNVPVIAFSTDANVAARGVYLLSFLPESDVERIIGYAASQGQPLVRRADSGQRLWQRGRGRVQAGGGAPRRPRRRARALSRGQGEDAGAGQDRGAGGDGASRADAIFIPDGADGVPAVVQIADRQRRRSQTRAAPRHRPVGGSADLLQSAARRRLVCRAPTRPASATSPAATAAATARIPVRTASLAYDAVALVAALVKTQGQQRFSEKRADHRLRLHRHRRAVPLPPRRHQPARARGDEGVAHRRPDHQPAAEGFCRVGDVDAGAAGSEIASRPSMPSSRSADRRRHPRARARAGTSFRGASKRRVSAP